MPLTQQSKTAAEGGLARPSGVRREYLRRSATDQGSGVFCGVLAVAVYVLVNVSTNGIVKVRVKLPVTEATGTPSTFAVDKVTFAFGNFDCASSAFTIACSCV